MAYNCNNSKSMNFEYLDTKVVKEMVTELLR